MSFLLTRILKCVDTLTLADKLGIDLASGVKDDEDAELRREEFGTNKRDPLVA